MESQFAGAIRDTQFGHGDFEILDSALDWTFGLEFKDLWALHSALLTALY